MKHIRTRLFGITLSFIMLISLLPVTALAGEAAWNGTTVDTSWYDDNTTDTEFTISDSADLAGLAKLVNAGNNFSDKTIKLGADIDLGGKEWTPIGNSTNSFKGVFEGNKHTISNLFINSPTKSNIGLFGVTQSGEVKNFILKNAKVTGYLEVGAVAGTPYTSKYTNITVTGLIQVNGFSYVGGAFGKNAYADLRNVDVTGDKGSYVKADSVENGIAYRTYLGGLAGFMGEGNITVSDCDVKIDVTGSTCDVGGILGILHYGNTLKNCTYAGSLTLTDPEGESDNEFGALVGVINNGGSATTTTTITGCTASGVTATEGGKDVTDAITAHGGFYNDVTGSDNIGSVTVIATVNDKDVTADNNVAKIGDKGYKTLAAAIDDANVDTSGALVTVTITKSGNYAPFTITRANVTVEAADDVEATITVSSTDSVKNTIKASDVTLRNLDFISEDGASIIYYVGGQNPADSGNNLTLVGCTFTGDGTGTALFIHQPDITITGCTFQNFERGYYTCGDNHAAGKMTFIDNAFTNVRVPIDGYWGKAATNDTNITITGNTITPGSWGTSYLQLWDYAQYLRWEGNTDADRQGSAIKATISGNTYNGDVVIYATHFNWFSQSNLTMDQAAQDRVKYRVLVELENAASATVTNKDGSAITAFNENTSSSDRGGKKVIYAITEGDYIFNIKPTDSTGDGLVTESVTVKPTTVDPSGSTTNKVTVDAGEVYVAQVGKTKYTTLADAINAAKTGGNKTVDLLSNVKIDSWDMIWNLSGITINGNNKTIKINGIESGQNHDAVFHSLGGNTFKDLTVDLSGVTAGSLAQGSRAFSAAPDDSFSNVTVIGNEHVSYGITVGGTDAVNETVTIDGCHFEDLGYAVYDSESAGVENLIIKNSTMTDCDYAVILHSENAQFTGNIVDSGKLNIMSDKQTVTGNTFTDGSRIKFYDQPAAFEKNKISTDSYLEANTGVTGIDVSENYWGGNAPSAGQLKGVNVTGSDVYYVHPAMQPSDLNTYVPPTTGGGSSSSGDYLITVDKTTGGKVTVNPGRADKGDEVTITVKPNDGYELDQLSVTDKDGDSVKVTNKGNGKYTFTMPGSQITIKATFKAAESSALDNFTDVNSNAWYADAVEFVIEEGLMTGTSDTTFAPDTSMSRAMIWTVLAAYNGANTSGGNPWYAPSQQWAMINGVSDGSAPNGSITREQLAVMLWRAAGSPSTSKNLTGYADANAVSDWAVEALAWAVDNGIISGMSGSSLAPQNTATRAQVAVMLMQFVECMDA